MSEPTRIPLAASLANRDGTVTKDGLLVNCYEEQNPIGTMIVKRPGLNFFANYGFGCAQGAITFNGQMLIVMRDQYGVVVPSGASGASWTTLTPQPDPAGGETLANGRTGYLVSFNNNLYAIAAGSFPSTASSVWVSTDNGISWAFSGSLPIPFPGRGNRAVTYNGAMYLVGPSTFFPLFGSNGVIKSTDGITWTIIADYPSIVLNTDALLVHNNLLFSLNQANISSSSDGITWTLVNAAPSWAAASRINIAAWSLNGNLYVGGGFNTTASTPYNDVWKSTDNGVTWTQITAGAAWAARHRSAFWVYNNKLWILGGATTLSSFTALDNLYSSSDGITWTLANSAVIGFGGSWYAFTVHNSTLYVGNYFHGFGASVSLAKILKAADVQGGVTTPNTLTALSPAPSISCAPFSLTLIPALGSTPLRVFLKNSTLAWVYDGTTLTQITDVDYPPLTVPGVAYLDGSIYVMSPQGIVFGSDLNDPLSWNALNFISANSEADSAVVLARQLNYIVAFKQTSTEFFFDAANSIGSPLGKVLNALLEIGCAHAQSLAFADNTIYFAANSRQKGRSIMKLEGYTPKVISTPYIDRILNSDDLAGVYAFVVKSNGHFFYVLTLTTSKLTLVYDETTSKWHTWSRMTANSALVATSAVVQTDGSILVTMPLPHGQNDGDVVLISGASPAAVNGQFNLRFGSQSGLTFNYFPDTPVVGAITGTISVTFYTETFFPGVYYSYGNGKDLLLDIANGYVYNFDPKNYQDSGQPIDVLIQTAILDFGSMVSKRFNRLELVGDKETTNVYTRFTDDDYQTWSLYRGIPLAQKRAKISSLGSARRRAFQFRNTGNTALRLLAAEMDVEQGAF
jgi:hypothetical protein